MWRDQDGIVHTVANPDPFGTLPVSLLEGLREALLTAEDEEGAALERLGDVQGLLQDWINDFFDSLPDDFDADEEPAYAQDDCGPVDDEEDDPTERVAPSVVGALRDYIWSVEERERLGAMEDILSVVNTWEDLYIDHEKVVGHMLLRHREEKANLVGLCHDAALARHAILHQQLGPAHPAVD